jgi:GT2 family glycosyltransferase
MTERVDISVVVATRDRAARLRSLLAGLDAQTLPGERFEVIVVDDGSRDETPEVLAAAHAGGSLRAFVQPESRGPAAARNRGWREAAGDLIAFTDDDCVPVPEWLEALLDAARSQPGAIVQGQTLPNPDELDGLGPFARTLEVSEPSPHYQTCNIVYPRDVLARLEGFDEDYGAPAGEDTDLGWRARAAAVDTVFAPEALVHHAVHQRGAVNALRDALRATDCVQAYKDHPGLRAHLSQGLFFHRSHPLLAQAALAAVLARRTPAAAVFALPYVLHLQRRCRAARAPAHAAPFFVARDIVEIAATVRGAVRYRVPVL